MAGDLQNRTPRHVREAKAFRTLQLGAVTGAGFAVTTVLWIAGLINDHPAFVLLILTIICAARFASLTGLSGAKRRR